jgi:hypothetical protein
MSVLGRRHHVAHLPHLVWGELTRVHSRALRRFFSHLKQCLTPPRCRGATGVVFDFAYIDCQAGLAHSTAGNWTSTPPCLPPPTSMTRRTVLCTKAPPPSVALRN